MIFCVEDDESIQSLELYALRSAGFEVRGFVDGDSFLEALRTEIPQLVILDVMLPGKSGVELLKLMKESSATREIAVIMATAKGAEYDKIQSLDLGADDYLVKPFSPAEMVARVRSHIQIHERLLEQRKKETVKEITVKNLTIFPEERRVLLDGEEVFLSNKEFDVLLFLAENPNIVFSKERLFDRVWGMDAVGTMATVTVHVNRVREKLNNQFIDTVWGAGYRFRVR